MEQLIRRESKVKAIVVVLFGLFVSAGMVLADTVSTSVTVGNSTPSVSSVNINGSTAIILTENTTTDITTTVTVTDANGCSTISAVTLDLYRSGVTASGCDTGGEADANNCYPVTICTIVGSGNTCTGSGDTSADYECVTSLQFYTDATDSGTYAAQTWEATVTGDDGTATATGTDIEEVNTLLALDVTASVAYGSVSAGTNTGVTNQTATITNTGNAAEDTEISGAGTAMCTDYPTCSGGQVDHTNQKYGFSDAIYGSLTYALSGTPTSRETVLAKPTSGAAVSDETYWGIAIDSGQAVGSYAGVNTFTAVTD